MPDPVGSSSSSVDWCAATDGGEVGALGPDDATARADALGETPVGAAVLTRKFQENHYAFLAAAAVDDPRPRSAPPTVTSSAALPPNPQDQIDVQIGLPRFERHGSVGPLHLTGAIDLLNASVHLGSQNSDGSQGENVGATLTEIGGEVTVEYSGWSLTAGWSSSWGASVSSGEGRDLDGDGRAERCFQASFGPLTLGECDEL